MNKLTIRQFRYGMDNLGYLVCGEKSAVAIDGGAVHEYLDYLVENNLELTIVTNTHCHPDHTAGNESLVRETGALLLNSFEKSKKGGVIYIDGEKVGVVSTPGHTADSVIFSLDGALITGDTLFNGTVGNCYMGDLEVYLRSLKGILAFPGGTLIYSGHDYVAESLSFAREIEPGNPALENYESKVGKNPLRSTLAQEKAVNPFVRFNEQALKEALRSRNLSLDTEMERWKSVMSL